MTKCGTGKDHCCWLEGRVCKYVRPSDREGYVWDCGLRADLGSWKKVYASKEYKRDVKEKMNAVGGLGLDCGEWKPGPRGCSDCGEGV